MIALINLLVIIWHALFSFHLLSSPLLPSPPLSFYSHLYTLFSSFCRASQATGIPTKIFAVEKNLHAVITLRNRAVSEEWENVQIIEKEKENEKSSLLYSANKNNEIKKLNE